MFFFHSEQYTFLLYLASSLSLFRSVSLFPSLYFSRLGSGGHVFHRTLMRSGPYGCVERINFVLRYVLESRKTRWSSSSSTPAKPCRPFDSASLYFYMGHFLLARPTPDLANIRDFILYCLFVFLFQDFSYESG